MPRRLVPLVDGEYYHVFNRGNNKIPIFRDLRDYRHFVYTARYYSASKPPLRLSKFLKLSREIRANYWKSASTANKIISTMCFCLMPNHFHFLLQQTSNKGISNYMKRVQDSYSRYFNRKYHRIGPPFQGQFKVVRVEDEEQLLHLSRYIHLNPYTSNLVTKIKELENYPWSSFKDYSGTVDGSFTDPSILLDLVGGTKNYYKFVINQADYQKRLHEIKHLLVES